MEVAGGAPAIGCGLLFGCLPLAAELRQFQLFEQGWQSGLQRWPAGASTQEFVIAAGREIEGVGVSGLNLDCAELLAALAICAAALLTLLAGSLGATAFRLGFFRLCVVAAGAGLGLPARLHGLEAPQNRAVP